LELAIPFFIAFRPSGVFNAFPIKEPPGIGDASTILAAIYAFLFILSFFFLTHSQLSLEVLN
jgi:hypothetical protein